MEKRLVPRGGLAGAFAGLLAFVFARIVAEPRISKATDDENGGDAAQTLPWGPIAAIGLVLGPLAERVPRPAGGRAPVPAPDRAGA